MTLTERLNKIVVLKPALIDLREVRRALAALELEIKKGEME